MIATAFEYARPKTLSEALELISARDGDVKLLAGGHSLIPMMKLRLAQPAVLVDIGSLPGLGEIAVAGTRVALGALVTHAALAASDVMRRHAGALWDAANNLGDPQVRNRGTAGGGCAHGDPASDYPAVMLALDATFTLAGQSGTREVRAAEFFRGPFETALNPDEILTQIAFESAPHAAYLKLEHPASHYALAGAAVALELRDGTIASARVAFSGIGDVAVRAGRLEKTLVGIRPSDLVALAAACADAAKGIEARSDRAASGGYRRAMAEVFAARAIARAASR